MDNSTSKDPRRGPDSKGTETLTSLNTKVEYEVY